MLDREQELQEQNLERVKGDFLALTDDEARHKKLLEKLQDKNIDIALVLMVYIDVFKDKGEAPNLEGVDFTKAIAAFLNKPEDIASDKRSVDISHKDREYLRELFLAATSDANFTCLNLYCRSELSMDTLEFLLSFLPMIPNITKLDLSYMEISAGEAEVLSLFERIRESNVKELDFTRNQLCEKLGELPSTINHLEIGDNVNAAADELELRSRSENYFQYLPTGVKKLDVSDTSGLKVALFAEALSGRICKELPTCNSLEYIDVSCCGIEDEISIISLINKLIGEVTFSVSRENGTVEKRKLPSAINTIIFGGNAKQTEVTWSDAMVKKLKASQVCEIIGFELPQNVQDILRENAARIKKERDDITTFLISNRSPVLSASELPVDIRRSAGTWAKYLVGSIVTDIEGAKLPQEIQAVLEQNRINNSAAPAAAFAVGDKRNAGDAFPQDASEPVAPPPKRRRVGLPTPDTLADPFHTLGSAASPAGSYPYGAASSTTTAAHCLASASSPQPVQMADVNTQRVEYGFGESEENKEKEL
jgi:hypothetical protein